MSSGSEGRRTQQLLLMATKRVQDRETSPELGPKTWVQKQQGHRISDTKVAVIYYLSQNGQLEHPHFMEVSLSSSHGLLRLKGIVSALKPLYLLHAINSMIFKGKSLKTATHPCV